MKKIIIPKVLFLKILEDGNKKRSDGSFDNHYKLAIPINIMIVIINAPIISQKLSHKLVRDILHPLIAKGENN